MDRLGAGRPGGGDDLLRNQIALPRRGGPRSAPPGRRRAHGPRQRRPRRTPPRSRSPAGARWRTPGARSRRDWRPRTERNITEPLAPQAPSFATTDPHGPTRTSKRQVGQRLRDVSPSAWVGVGPWLNQVGADAPWRSTSAASHPEDAEPRLRDRGVQRGGDGEAQHVAGLGRVDDAIVPQPRGWRSRGCPRPRSAGGRGP